MLGCKTLSDVEYMSLFHSKCLLCHSDMDDLHCVTQTRQDICNKNLHACAIFIPGERERVLFLHAVLLMHFGMHFILEAGE